MRVLQLVAADRWTGAAATALQLAEALRGAGVDCQLAFRPGRGLEERLLGLEWCHPILAKERGPADLARAARRVRALAAGCDVVHCHLPHDHLLAKLALGIQKQGTVWTHLAGVFAGERHAPLGGLRARSGRATLAASGSMSQGDALSRGQGEGDTGEGMASRGQEGELGRQGADPGPRAPALVRSVRHPDHLRPNLYHRWLFRDTAGLGLANSSMVAMTRDVPELRAVPAEVLPVANEARFVPGCDRDGARARLGIPAGAVVAGTIGKLDGTRGQDVFLRGLAGAPEVWGLIVGKGPGVPLLQALARELGVAGRLAWAGYAESGLEDLYAAMDLFVFPAAGSDWGHRAIAEASACGLPTLAADLPGVADLVALGATGDLYPAGDPAALGHLLGLWGSDPGRRHACGRRAAAIARERWTPAELAAAALRLYARARATTCSV